MFNSPLKPVVKRRVKKQSATIRHHSQRSEDSISLFDPMPPNTDDTTSEMKSKPYRLDSYISYSSRLAKKHQSSSTVSSSQSITLEEDSSFALHHELMFRKFIPLEKHFRMNYQQAHYRKVCSKALLQTRLIPNLEEFASSGDATISTPLSSSLEPYSPFSPFSPSSITSSSSSSTFSNSLHTLNSPSKGSMISNGRHCTTSSNLTPKKLKNSSKKRDGRFSPAMSFHYKGRMGFTSMLFMERCGISMSPPVLVAGDAKGSIQLFSIGDYCHSGGSNSSKKVIEKPCLKFSIPMRSFVNRICTTKSGACLVASDDSTLFFYDLCRQVTGSHHPTIKFEGHTNYLTDVKKNTFENLFMSSSMDKTVKIWSPQTSKFVFSLNIKEYVNSCCWMPNSNHYMLTCSQKVITTPCSESCIKIWDLRKLSSHVCEIIQNGKFNELRSSASTYNDADSESEDSDDSFSGSSLFGFWSATSKSRQSKQSAAITSFGGTLEVESSDYYDSTTQMYVEPFIPHRVSEKIFDIQFLDDSHLLSTSPFCSKIWRIHELCGINGNNKNELNSMNVTGLCTLSHKYYSDYDDTSVQSCNVVPTIHLQTGHLVKGCKDGNLYVWNFAIHTPNTNKRTNFTTRIKPAHSSAIRSVCFSNEGDLFASCDQLGHLNISSIYDGTTCDSMMDDRCMSMNDSTLLMDMNCSFDSSSTSHHNTSQISVDMSSIFLEEKSSTNTTNITTTQLSAIASGSSGSNTIGDGRDFEHSHNIYTENNLLTTSPQKRSKDVELDKTSSRRKKKKK
ncbi:hypothetical protein FDP41_012696 [Naegleria fowleri]|uniref:Uncharacterized protein n=1 Tax=Naegleria fowleri TaxID=5763 RepID=A0A6A5C4X7_NAEFO|nr:uncharacterized protein FDP41_012696 [Naegleria fowleri]KAF0980908.1 hypothetical protein FDP41_012696 [Naegleria fowleri]CAG4716609.1 unnamed protein product [Naegleria fowleri]